MNKLIRIDRVFAWVLLVSMLLFFISGYGMTKGIIASAWAVKIHNSVLPPVAIISFTIHTWYAIHLAFKRWRIWSWFSKLLLALFYITFVGYFGYLEYFYKQDSSAKNSTETTEAVSAPSATTSVTPALSPSPTNQTKTFTLAELAKYNGKNGQPAYVAVDGRVYDVSTLFVNGIHQGWSAGQDLSSEFHIQHATQFLSGYKAVGTLAN